MNLIKLGEFVEQDGSPAYIIKGEIETGNIEVIEKTVLSNLYESNIIQYFSSGQCDCPRLVLEKLLSLPSGYFPVHFFIREMDMTNDDALAFIESFEATNINTKNSEKIIERLKTDYQYGKTGVINTEIKEKLFEGNYSTEHIVSLAKKYKIRNSAYGKIKRSLIYNSMKDGEPIAPELISTDPSLVVDAFTNLNPNTIKNHKEYILNLIPQLYQVKSSTYLKKAICYVDKILYAKD